MTMDICNVTVARDDFRVWKKPLCEWFKVLDEYLEANPGEPDVAYWHNERATLSTVAGALWRSGFIVLEEYRTLRGGGGPDARRGRTDLWCRLGGDEYTVEAKQGWNLSYPCTPENLIQGANTQLKQAMAQCATDNYGGKNRLAMVFMVPSLLENPSNVDKWVQKVEDFRADLKAYYFKLPAPQSTRNQRYFPGVVLLARGAV